MSTSSVQNMVAPPVPVAKIQEFSAANVEDPREPVSGSNANKTDFRALITNSMDNVIKERKAKENGDLSAAKTDEEFLEKLADQTKEKRVAKNELGKDDFLKLFVTQLQNQNPLNPEADTEMAAKLAQFNGLEQMLNVNKSLEKMLAEQGSARNLQLVNYVGRDVTVEGGRVRVKDGAPTQTEYSVENAAAQSTLEIRNSAGILVNQIDLGPVDAGTHTLKWDGKTHDGKSLGDGVYTLSMTARNLDGKPIPVSLTSKVRVTGIDVNNKDGGLYSDFGRIKLDQIKSVGLPGFDHNMTEAPGTKPLLANNMSEDLDRLKAEGKLDLKNKIGTNPAEITGSPKAATLPDQTLSPPPSSSLMGVKEPGKAPTSGSAKKSIDQRRSASAKLDEKSPEKSSQIRPVSAQDQQKSAATAL